MGQSHHSHQGRMHVSPGSQIAVSRKRHNSHPELVKAFDTEASYQAVRSSNVNQLTSFFA